ENLRRSVEQRLAHNRSALALAEAFRAARLVQERKMADDTEGALLDAGALLQLLQDHTVDFVVIGGLPMIAHGSAYVTKDLDLCYNRPPRNIAAVPAAFATINPYLRGAPPGLPFRFDAPTIQAGLNFTLATDRGDIDLLGEVSGIGSYAQVF